MRRTINLKQLEEIVKTIPTIKIEVECNAYGCVTPHYKELIDPSDVMEYVLKATEDLKVKKIKSICRLDYKGCSKWLRNLNGCANCRTHIHYLDETKSRFNKK